MCVPAMFAELLRLPSRLRRARRLPTRCPRAGRPAGMDEPPTGRRAGGR